MHFVEIRGTVQFHRKQKQGKKHRAAHVTMWKILRAFHGTMAGLASSHSPEGLHGGGSTNYIIW